MSGLEKQGIPPEPTRAAVEAELRLKEEYIARRLEALQEEVLGTRQSVRRVMDRRPLFGLAATVVAGLAVGLLVGGRKSRPRNPAGNDEALSKALVEAYFSSLADNAREAVDDGEDARSATREALRHRPPVVLSVPRENEVRQGWVGLFFSSLVKAMIGIFATNAVTTLVAKMQGGDMAGAEAVDMDGLGG